MDYRLFLFKTQAGELTHDCEVEMTKNVEKMIEFIESDHAREIESLQKQIAELEYKLYHKEVA